ncbi:hypothetical protein [Falsiroseomonas tokyonensis]|uniref:Uncharacterized protein n=1 Tax=Falsiroseomonas tokyonensis TaxID=430521 RepID=A0ABV7BMF1_9PROT|nr:hypothetical protein [Falsiroseomonas tokyonensis]MBU8536750.1 hypothetical protein [Falsiroseomonas tokyonensis]
MVDTAGQPKSVARLLSAGGPPALAETLKLSAPRVAADLRPIVVMGGAGGAAPGL